MRGDKQTTNNPYFPLIVYRQGEGSTVEIDHGNTAALNVLQAPFKEPTHVKFTGEGHAAAAEAYATFRNTKLSHPDALERVALSMPVTVAVEYAE